jgi:hypothetical protein
MTWLKGLMGRHDEKLAEDAVEARAVGLDPNAGLMTPADQNIKQMADKLGYAEEHRTSE